MNPFLRSVSLTFSAGAFGGLVNSLIIWWMGLLGITQALRIRVVPELTPEWLYPRIVWGGIWGFLFLFPFRRDSIVWRGFILSLGPTLFISLFIFPYWHQAGWFGVYYGYLMPLFALFVNAAWGISAAWFLKVTGEA